MVGGRPGGGMPRMPGGALPSLLWTAGGLLTGNAKAMLMAEDGYLPVMFTVNPSSVHVVKKNTVEGKRGVLTSSAQDSIKASGNIRLEIKEAHLMGVGTTQMACNQLVKWATPAEIPMAVASFLDPAWARAQRPKKSALPKPGGGNPTDPLTKDTEGETEEPKAYALPVLLFSWGLYGPRGSIVPVTLESVTLDYKRFDPLGLPIWVKVSVTLVEVAKPNGGTNPTSGGVAGRATHTIQQGENVVQIANRAYGSPQAWRAVAAANGLDDPLRVRPGRQLALPPASSFTQSTR
jgi:nucleoid-associated protein YgaU